MSYRVVALPASYFSRSHTPCPPLPQHRLMHRSIRHQVGYNVDTLALSRPPFDCFLRPLQQGCMILADPSYLSCQDPMKVVVQTLLLEALPVVIHP
jgi:hypothetical protein